MKFTSRECCDVVLKAKSAQKIGNKVFYAGEPVCYFDTLKTSSMEGSATTVYATGGRGNARLASWDGDRTVTFTMEDAMISPEGFMILSGAGLTEASEKPVYQHITETVDASQIEKSSSSLKKGELSLKIPLSEKPYLPTDMNDNYAYVMLMKNGEIVSEPFIPVHEEIVADSNGKYLIEILAEKNLVDGQDYVENENGFTDDAFIKGEVDEQEVDVYNFDAVLVDYYVEHKSNAYQINISADTFGGNYYLEASTLFRDTNGVDLPAEFIIPNCRVQSNFTFSMSGTGDPSTFTFTLDAFPDYTKFDHSQKVYSAIQIIKKAGSQNLNRHSTWHEAEHDKEFG